MKRNKPLFKQRKRGTQARRRWRYAFGDSGKTHWALTFPRLSRACGRPRWT